jgi:alpha-tubulin suppressor-like RCC1 family protein
MMQARNLTLMLVAVLLTFGRCAFAGSAVAWGSNGGNLGDGTMINRTSPVAVIGMSSGVTAVSAGDGQAMALQNGGVFDWGTNGNGELGNGTTTDSTVPVPVTGMSSGVTAIAAGGSYNLAIQNGAVFAWGYNYQGELGNGTTNSSSPPYGRSTPVAVGGGLNTGVSAITCGSYFSLAIKNTNGNNGVYTWGQNNAGQLGNGTKTDSDTPLAVSGLSSGVAAIAGGGDFALAIQNGGVLAWGDNVDGQLGNNTNTTSSVPAAVIGLTGVTAIACGGNSGFAIKDGNVYAWGSNGDGQLGDGTTTNHLTPEEIDPSQLTNIIEIASGQDSTYALASNGILWVWGYNQLGELGLGNTTSYQTPQQLKPPTGYVFTSISSDPSLEYAVATEAPVQIPEPTSLSLLAVGGVALLRRRRRVSR